MKFDFFSKVIYSTAVKLHTHVSINRMKVPSKFDNSGMYFDHVMLLFNINA